MNDKVKSLFFSQYWGQSVLYYSNTSLSGSPITSAEFGSKKIKNGYLLLRDIRQLSDQEIKIIAGLNGWNSPDVSKEKYEERILQYKIDLPCICNANYKHRHLQPTFEYLKLIGILLPFIYLSETNQPITLTPAEIINLGWAKLQSNEQ